MMPLSPSDPNHSPGAFRVRCQLALTHPVTVGALGVLLLNDLVFKALWSNPWTTGKLSDLAWLVFASPLLAWLLSLLARQNSRWQRAAWIEAYIGLPLLYAAFNTFPPVHDAILRVLSLISGGVAGSPLDATDSLVIPVGLAVALWVWRRGNAGAGVLRQRLVLLTAGVAVVASVATSQPAPPDYGIINVWISDHGSVMEGGWWYESTDGGFNWAPVAIEFKRGNRPLSPPSGSVGTPRGTYMIRGPEIVHIAAEGSARVVYTAGYLLGDAHEWVQRYAKKGDGRVRIASQPVAITYDPKSGNVIVAMGLQGVVVGTPDGRWARIGVGKYQPTDFTPNAKIRTLFADGKLRAAGIALPLSVLGLAVAGSRIMLLLDSGTDSDWRRSATTAQRISALLAVAAGIIAAIFALILWGHLIELRYPKDPYVFIGKHGRDATISLFFATLGMIFCAGYFPANWRAIVSALVGIMACIILTLALWMLFNFSVVFAQVAGAVLVVLIGLTLFANLTGKSVTEWFKR